MSQKNTYRVHLIWNQAIFIGMMTKDDEMLQKLNARKTINE